MAHEPRQITFLGREGTTKHYGIAADGPLPSAALAEAVRALAEREGLDLSLCSAYSDSYNDLPMLSIVGEAVAINPDARLRAHARAAGWQVRDYRTGRKAARLGLVLGAATGAATGAVAAGVALRGRHD